MRQFCRLKSKTTSIKPPIQLFDLAGKYATSLFMAAQRTDKLPICQKELAQIATELKKHEFWLQNPTLSIEQKHTGLKKRLPTALIDINVRFFSLLAENGRLHMWPEIYKQFQTLMDAHRGIVTAHVKSFLPLSLAEKNTIEKQVKALFGEKKLIIEVETDASLLGGMVVRVEDRVIDMSVANQLKTLDKLL